MNLLQRLLDAWDDWRARHRRIDPLALHRSIWSHPASKGRRP